MSDQINDCLFCKIVRGKIPCQKVYEDELILAFNDISHAAPVHFLIIPKQHIASLYESAQHPTILGLMLAKAGNLAQEQGLHEGFRSIINTGRIGGQEVYHLHLHVLGGPQPLGPMINRR